MAYLYDDEEDSWRPHPDPEAEAAAPLVEKEPAPLRERPLIDPLHDLDYLAHLALETGFGVSRVPYAPLAFNTLVPRPEAKSQLTQSVDKGFNFLSLLGPLAMLLGRQYVPKSLPPQDKVDVRRANDVLGQVKEWSEQKPWSMGYPGKRPADARPVPQIGGPSGTGVTVEQARRLGGLHRADEDLDAQILSRAIDKWLQGD